MGILDMRKLWSGSEGDDIRGPEEVLAYVGAHVGAWLNKQLVSKCVEPASATMAAPPRGGDPVSDGDLPTASTGNLLGPGILPMKGDSPVRMASSSRISHEDTLLIFDWDDTILCSSWLSSQRLRLDKNSEPTCDQRRQLDELAGVAAQTLRRAKELGTVIIVTNAERGWIELTCSKYMPALLPILEGISLISARSTYESPEVRNPLDWKLAAFEREIQSFYREGAGTAASPQRLKNILSLGDSIHERQALMRCAEGLPNCFSKSLKFLVKPDVGQVSQQHSLVLQSFDRIVHHRGSLDLRLQCA